ncbi:DUF317 domain-containing protein [Streptomyces sp. NPDC050161]|uniref:DUF317 domain-containing protein n=1 Tax=Streptomyces sp. NPDC050161 TaxID=3365604 RepID=UPI00378C9F03
MNHEPTPRAPHLCEVSPRPLAGGGDPRHVTEYLLAAGWSNRSAASAPFVLLQSPNGQLYLTLDPASPDPHTDWWHIQTAQGWSAHFGGHTPVEIIAGFTDALTSTAPAPTGESQTSDLWQLAVDRGWPQMLHNQDRFMLSPDETTVLARVRASVLSDTPTWRWQTDVQLPLADGRRHWLWGASIDGNAPDAALRGFITALTDPAPLHRYDNRLPFRAVGHLTLTRSSHRPEQERQRQKRIDSARRTASPSAPANRPAPAPTPARKRR